MKQTLRCIYPFESIDPADLWEDVRSVLKRLGKLSSSLASGSTLRRVENPDCEHFGVFDERFEIDFAPTASPGIDQLFVTADSDEFVDHDIWIESLNQTHPLIQAFLFDVDYNYWQNANDPLLYTSKDRDYAHLPMKLNGWPPPLDRMVIDTSTNPGRWEFRNGFVEAVTSPLWLGSEFWRVTGHDQSAVMASELWQDLEELEGGLMLLRAQFSPFDSDEGEQALLQNAMRKLIYPEEATANKSKHKSGSARM